jgi:hypothetical protein
LIKAGFFFYPYVLLLPLQWEDLWTFGDGSVGSAAAAAAEKSRSRGKKKKKSVE